MVIPRRQIYRLTLLTLILSAMLFTYLGVIARDRVIFDWEIELFTTIYRWPEALFPFFIVVTQLGNALIVPVLVGVALLRKNLKLGANVLMTGTLTLLLLFIAKEMIARPRPVELLTGVSHHEPMIYGFGFPSGHTALSIAMALTLFAFVPKRWRWVLLVWVIVVPISRIYLAAHVPTDLVGGYALGIISFCIVKLSDVVTLPTRSVKKVLN